MDAILKFGPFVNAFALELISTSLHQLFVMPVSASFGQFRLDALEVDPSAGRPSLKEACHDIHGIGHYIDEYTRKKCCKPRLQTTCLLRSHALLLQAELGY